MQYADLHTGNLSGPLPRWSESRGGSIRADLQWTGHPRAARIAEVTTTGFKIRMNELVAHGGQQAVSNGVHCAETVGWVAFAV